MINSSIVFLILILQHPSGEIDATVAEVEKGRSWCEHVVGIFKRDFNKILAAQEKRENEDEDYWIHKIERTKLIHVSCEEGKDTFNIKPNKRSRTKHEKI